MEVTTSGDANNSEAVGWEEYYDYLFPDDQDMKGKSLKILEIAHKWKKGATA